MQSRFPNSQKLQDEEKASAELNPEHLHAGEEHLDFATAKILGVAILEFGVALHSILIGLTLAVDPDFKVLFVVLVFHRQHPLFPFYDTVMPTYSLESSEMFEGLGIGSRLATLDLRKDLWYVPYIGAGIYGLTTPIGIAVGLGVRSTYNPNTARASIVSGVLDSISAGILIYTGLVEVSKRSSGSL